MQVSQDTLLSSKENEKMRKGWRVTTGYAEQGRRQRQIRVLLSKHEKRRSQGVSSSDG
jgi:hypothetical protein